MRKIDCYNLIDVITSYIHNDWSPMIDCEPKTGIIVDTEIEFFCDN